ncbi:hypothetical protein V6Z12_A07G172100 [Gossypium hirsutum]
MEYFLNTVKHDKNDIRIQIHRDQSRGILGLSQNSYIDKVLKRRDLSNPGIDHWIATKRVIRYLQRLKDYMLSYNKSNHLEVASNYGIWLRNFVTELRILENVERPFKLFCDNKSTVLYSNNNSSSFKLKYIDIKFLVVKEIVQNRQISIEHIGTNSMIVDPLIKGSPPKVFHEHTAHMDVTLFEDIMV